jgi:CTP:molybdopterin cytidylyltransferase MocA
LEVVTNAGLILAAGAGTRFGGTKQLAPLRGRPLLEHAVQAMLGADLDRVVVVLGHEAQLIRSRVAFGAAELVVASEWATGQAASLRAGVRSVLGADAVAITLGDQPFITSSVITESLRQLDGYDAVRAMYEGKPGHPVVFGRPVIEAVGSIEGDVGARDILSRFNVNRWDASSLASAVDVDTVAELEAL